MKGYTGRFISLCRTINFPVTLYKVLYYFVETRILSGRISRFGKGGKSGVLQRFACQVLALSFYSNFNFVINELLYNIYFSRI